MHEEQHFDEYRQNHQNNNTHRYDEHTMNAVTELFELRTLGITRLTEYRFLVLRPTVRRYAA